MKSIILFLLLLPMFVSAQYDSTKNRQTNNAYGFNFKNISVSGSFIIPNDTPRLAQADSNAIATLGGRVYAWTGSRWNSFEVMITSDPNKLDSVTYRSDTLWQWKNGVSSFIGEIIVDVSAKLNISDTAAMLIPYLRKTDTTVMLANYIRRQELRDTAAAIRSDFPTGGGATSLDNVGTGFDLAQQGTDNVKRLALGFGLLGDSTSTTLTLRADSTKLATKYSVDTMRIRINADLAGTGVAALLDTGTVTVRLAIPSPIKGQVFYQTDELEGIYTYTGAKWQYHPPANSMINDFDAVTPVTYQFSGGASGTGALQTPFYGLFTDNIANGVLNCNMGTSNNGSHYQLYPAAKDSGYKASFISHVRLKFSTLSNVTDEYRIIVGPAENIFSANIYTGSACLVYRRDTYGDNWQMIYKDAGAATVVNTGIPVVAGTYYDLCINYDHTTQRFRAYVNGVLVDTRVFAMPNLTIYRTQFYWQKSAGTTTSSLVIDKMYLISKVN